MILKNKVALITGGNSGIGLATARRFIEEGALVAITGRNISRLTRAKLQLGANLSTFELDVNDPDAIKNVANAVAEDMGPIDVLFANAGTAATTPLGVTSAESFNSLISTNLASVFFTVQSCLPYFDHGASVILNGSVHATQGIPGWAAYAAAKGGVRSLTRVLASELAPRGIRVNQVTPGATRTPSAFVFQQCPPLPPQTRIGFSVFPKTIPLEAWESQLKRKIPLGRLGEAEEIAEAVLFLASAASSNITAQELVIDGGATGAPLGAPIYRM
jgi:NAD(P)-dependent dehydrogenase (short-subunit alcohol dehydrogenase family)